MHFAWSESPIMGCVIFMGKWNGSPSGLHSLWCVQEDNRDPAQDWKVARAPLSRVDVLSLEASVRCNHAALAALAACRSCQYA